MKNVLFFLLGIVLFLFVAALLMPKQLKMEREVTIDRPVEEVFAYVSHLDNMDEVSVWMKRDPDMKKSNTGTDGQVGYVTRWESEHKDVGVGEQEILAIEENKRIDTALRFETPYESNDTAYMITEPVGDDQTKVIWGYESAKASVPMNLMFPLISGKLKKDFDTTLSNLKDRLERS